LAGFDNGKNPPTPDEFLNFFVFQVGNAVPPPMGKVLGLEIRKAMAEAEQKKKSGGSKLEAVEAAA
jgi:hypothetical protein